MDNFSWLIDAVFGTEEYSPLGVFEPATYKAPATEYVATASGASLRAPVTYTAFAKETAPAPAAYVQSARGPVQPTYATQSYSPPAPLPVGYIRSTARETVQPTYAAQSCSPTTPLPTTMSYSPPAYTASAVEYTQPTPLSYTPPPSWQYLTANVQRSAHGRTDNAHESGQQRQRPAESNRVDGPVEYTQPAPSSYTPPPSWQYLTANIQRSAHGRTDNAHESSQQRQMSTESSRVDGQTSTPHPAGYIASTVEYTQDEPVQPIFSTRSYKPPTPKSAAHTSSAASETSQTTYATQINTPTAPPPANNTTPTVEYAQPAPMPYTRVPTSYTQMPMSNAPSSAYTASAAEYTQPASLSYTPPPAWQQLTANLQGPEDISKCPSFDMEQRIAECPSFEMAQKNCDGNLARDHALEYIRSAEIAKSQSIEAERSCSNLVYGSPSSVHGTKTFRILCYGDSNSIGYIGEGKNLSPYGQALAAALRVAGVSCEVTCCGLCGFTSEELVDRINAPYIQPKTGPSSKGLAHVLKDAAPFDLVIIMVGTNDIGRFMDPRMTLAFTTRLHSACHALGIKTINIVPPTVGCNFKLNELQTQMRESRTRLAEITNAWAAGNPHVLLSLDCETLVPKNIAQLWEWDDIHLSLHGSQQLAKNLASQLIVTLGHLTQCNTQPVAISRTCQPVSQEPSQIFLDPVRWLNVRQPTPQRVVAYA